MSDPSSLALMPVGAFLGLVAAEFVRIVQQDGSWYHGLRIEDRDSFKNRAVYTYRNRIDVPATVLVTVGVSIILYAFSYVFFVGLFEVAG